ncbi:MAG: glycerol-3-phosphate dehydrogenase subunit GlpB [Muribaculaceae bacterium]
MKFDTIIIGGGLSGLTAGITLAEHGQKCLIVSAGQSSLHFFTGSFDLLNRGDNPIEAINQLPASHPYAKIGSERVAQLAELVKPMFASMGIGVEGSASQNHYRITPVGLLKPAWLTLDEFASVPHEGAIMPWKRIVVVNIKGFLDFNAGFVASNLAKQGITADIVEVTTPQLENLRRNPSEMRATNIAKTLVGDALDVFVDEVKKAASNAGEAVLLPAVFGISDGEAFATLQGAVGKPVKLIATLPPSVSGIRIQKAMQQRFQRLGGTILQGDAVVKGNFEGNMLKGVFTVNHGEREFVADNFILASGNFVTHGLASTRDGVFEPALGVDVDCLADRCQWTTDDIFAEQPFMSFGVATDARLRAIKNGKTVENLYATGNVLSGFNAVKDGCLTGVSLITGLNVAHEIIK